MLPVRQPAKKITAVALLLLFTFLHVVKVSHTHTALSHHGDRHQAECFNAMQASCEICDFQLAKDSDFPPALLVEAPVSFAYPDYLVYKEHILSRPVHQFPARGPPSFI